MDYKILEKLKTAYTLLKQGNFNEAKELCFEVIKAKQDIDGTANYFVGLCYLEDEQFNNAEFYFDYLSKNWNR